ncbi:guanitoxin biosynthesis L-enduracididine beta-hydroxylase GntD [Nocardiopsis quinghaiensis]|uniref:guanitoxin biosynthesis L-enduracididine beta-hydroxylase GntD n=1 Tax=Nocardiopsis quinghaiensis TaxID=464995 RepID=UPI00123BB898|nr:guanitoxin biosynthesis L-enduracididine beta-hydroxylase GntD [Nocardiopsis quinghaiensis]
MPTDDIAVHYHLTPAEVEEIEAALGGVDPDEVQPTDPAFYERHWALYASLPQRLRLFIERFRRTEEATACFVHGFPVDADAVGPTPQHWRTADGRPTRAQEVFMAMCALALGEPFTWSTLQEGRMIQNIFPVQGDELRQSGHGSEALLEFHTEDGFHPGRADYLMLFGIRNHDAVPTILSSVRDVKLDAGTARVLSEPRFLIMPDDEHVRQLQTHHPDHPALERVLDMQQRPEPVPVLFGGDADPYLRIDRPFMRCVGEDPVAEQALDTLMEELERVQHSVVVEPGTLMVVDNYLAVHGRKPFRSRYDGTDRWLKRMIVSRDVRKSAMNRMPESRRVLA